MSGMEFETNAAGELLEFLVPKVEGIPGRSKLWLEFELLAGEQARCRRCLRVVRTGGSTSNLHKHLRTHNLHKLPKLPATSITPITPTRSAHHIHHRTIKKQPIIFQVEVPISFLSRHCIQPEPVVPKEIAQKAIKKIGIFAEGGATHAEITNHLLNFIRLDNQSLNIVQGRGFKKLLNNVIPLYKIPSENNLKNHLEEKYKLLKSFYINKFSSIPHFSLSCDVWNNMLIVSVNFLDSGNISFVCIAVQELPVNYTSIYINNILVKELFNWKIDANKIVAVVADSSENMVKAITDQFGSHRYIPCFSKIIDSQVKKAFCQTSIVSVIDKVRSLFLWVKNNMTVSNEIQNHQSNSGFSEDQIKAVSLDTKGKWTSVYYMLERFWDLAGLLDEVLINYPEAPSMPTEDDLVIIKEILSLLKPLEHVIKEISDDPTITASKIMPMVNCVMVYYNALTMMDEELCGIRDGILLMVNQLFGQSELDSTMSLATLLDPRFKNLHFHDEAAATNSLRSLIPRTKQDVGKSGEYDFWSHHKSFVHSSKTDSNKDEVELYLGSSVCKLWTNPIRHWEEMKGMLPELYKLAMKYFTVAATSAPGEKLYMKNSVFNQDCKSQIGKLLFLAGCKENEWFS